jgi:hypothetical protein
LRLRRQQNNEVSLIYKPLTQRHADAMHAALELCRREPQKLFRLDQIFPSDEGSRELLLEIPVGIMYSAGFGWEMDGRRSEGERFLLGYFPVPQ